MSNERLIPIAKIDASDRLRPVDPDWAAAIAASFEARGQDTAIEVRPLPGGGDHDYKLTAGAHRLEAAKIAGWDAIKAAIVPRNEDEARLAEIDENLMRAELTALDRAVFLAKRKEVWERLHPETAHGGDRKSSKFKEKISSPSWRSDRFTEEAAERCGLSERTIQRACQLAETLGTDVIAKLRGTPLADNQAHLFALARLDEDVRWSVMQSIGPDTGSLTDAMRKAGVVAEADPDEAAFRALVGAWTRAGAKARRRFLKHIDKDKAAKPAA